MVFSLFFFFLFFFIYLRCEQRDIHARARFAIRVRGGFSLLFSRHTSNTEIIAGILYEFTRHPRNPYLCRFVCYIRSLFLVRVINYEKSPFLTSNSVKTITITYVI